MIVFKHTIRTSNGIHARPAGMLVQKIKELSSDVDIEHDGKEVNAKKLMQVIFLDIKKDDEIKIIINGEKEEEEAKILREYIEKNF